MKGLYRNTLSNITRSPITLLILSIIFFIMLVMLLDWAYYPILGNITNSDLIYIESIYRDIFTRHYPISGWLVSRAPYFFPDWILYALIRVIAGNYAAAWTYYLICNLAILLFIFYLICRIYSKSAVSKNILFAICWGTILVILLKYAPREYGVNTLILPVYHSGALLNGLLILWLWNYNLVNRLKNYQLILLATLAYVATLSDEWWIIWFGVPIGITSLILIFNNQIARLKNIVFLAIIGSAVIFGEWTTKLIIKYKWIYYPEVSPGDPSSTIPHQFYIIFRDILDLFLSSPLLFALFLASLMICTKAIVTKQNPILPATDLSDQKRQNIAYKATAIFIFVSYLVTLSFMAFFKLWELWNYRYIHTLILFPWLMVGLFLFRKLQTSCKPWRLFYSLTYTLPLVVFIPVAYCGHDSSFKNSRRGLSIPRGRQYDALIACVDETARSKNLKYGISEYWIAKMITETSTTGLIVNQFGYTLEPLHWMNNFYWYYKNPGKSNQLIDYDFIIYPNTDISWKKTIATIGDATESTQCANNTILIFKGKDKINLNSIMKPRIASFLDQMSNTNPNGANIWRTTNNKDNISSVIKSAPTTSTLQVRHFKEHSASDNINSREYLRWEINEPADYAFLEQHFSTEAIAGHNLALTFWARSLSGNVTFHSLGYLLPNGTLDNSSIPFHPNGDALSLDKKWRKFIIYYNVPTPLNLTPNKNNYALIRPIFFEKTREREEIEIADIKLLSRGKTSYEFTKKHGPNWHKSTINIRTLLEKADKSHVSSDFATEYWLLKKIEYQLNDIAVKEQIHNDAIYSANIPHTTDKNLRAELSWRLARVHYSLANKSSSTEERNVYLYIAAENAFSAYNITNTTNTLKWWAALSTEMGKIEGIRQRNIAEERFQLLINQALVSDPNNAELNALMGQWHYQTANLGLAHKLKSLFLLSPVPRGSLREAVFYLTRALKLAPHNKLYQQLASMTERDLIHIAPDSDLMARILTQQDR